MKTKEFITKGVVSVAVCAVTNAVVIGSSSNALNKIYAVESGEYTFRTYVSAAFVALTYITIFGFWLLYIPVLALYHAAAKQIKGSAWLYFILLGAIIGYSSGIPFLILTTDLTTESWYTLPNGRNLVTLPTLGIVGAVYGVVYRGWLFKNYFVPK